MKTDYLPVLERLIGFATVSSNSNLECIDYIEDFLSEKHFHTTRFYNHDRSKANLVARIGPQTAGGIMLAGHTDVVPVAGQDWFSDPFALVQKEDKLYGRGVADMKGFLALAMECAAAVDTGGLKKPLYLLFSYDEEIGCGGAKRLVEVLKSMPARPRFVLIGEPTNMDLVTAHKGISLSTTHIRGKAAHSSCPALGASAILAAVRLIQQIDTILPGDQDENFDPAGATFNIGTVHGGNAGNIIPQDCSFVWEFRPLPSQDAQAVQNKFAELVLELQQDMPGISVDHRVDSIVPGLQEGKNREIATQLQEHLPDSKLGTVPFVTEAGLYQQANIPAIVCGPGHVNQAHQPNEHISPLMMNQYRAFLFKLVETLTNA
jgi:acetylornithine deacetylase